MSSTAIATWPVALCVRYTSLSALVSLGSSTGRRLMEKKWRSAEPRPQPGAARETYPSTFTAPAPSASSTCVWKRCKQPAAFAPSTAGITCASCFPAPPGVCTTVVRAPFAGWLLTATRTLGATSA